MGTFGFCEFESERVSTGYSRMLTFQDAEDAVRDRDRPLFLKER